MKTNALHPHKRNNRIFHFTQIHLVNSLEYPTGWTATPKANRFQTTDVSFKDPTSITKGFVQIGYNVESPTTLGLRLAFLASESGLRSSLPDFLTIANPSYSQYTVAGNEAASVEFTTSVGKARGIDMAGLLVVSLIKEKPFFLVYTEDQNVYDKVLPTIQHMIDSFQPLA